MNCNQKNNMMTHLLRLIDDKLANVLKGTCFSKRVSNPKKATKRASVWWLLSLHCLLALPSWAQQSQQPAPRFVSLTLCSDRLLMALARPEQIAAMSPFSTQPRSMLGTVNLNKPVVRARLSELLPYADATILLNEHFYPQLVSRLKKIGFRVVGINDNPQTVDELFTLLRRLAALTGNNKQAEALIQQIRITAQQLREQSQGRSPQTALALSENGVLDTSLPQNQVLLDLLNLRSVEGFADSVSQFSAEQLLLANPQVLLTFAFSAAYNERGKWLEHPALASLMQGRVQAHTAAKYTFCFDHGVWQGAAELMAQLKSCCK